MYPESLRVLVVDDDPACARATSALLCHYGHAATVAAAGEEALLKAACLEPDVILLDLEMPGADGFEVARRLATTLRRKPPFLIAVSGRPCEDGLMMAFASGVNAYLPKPLDAAALLRLLRRFYSAARRAGAGAERGEAGWGRCRGRTLAGGYNTTRIKETWW